MYPRTVLGYFQPDQVRHLTVTILLDDIDSFALIDEILQLTRQGKRANAKVMRCEAIFLRQLVLTLFYGSICRTVCYDPDPGLLCKSNLRSGHHFSRRLMLPCQAIHQSLIIFRALGIAGLVIVAASTSEIRRQRVSCTR